MAKRLHPRIEPVAQSIRGFCLWSQENRKTKDAWGDSMGRFNGQELHTLTVIAQYSQVNGKRSLGNSANRAPIQRSDVHGNGERLCGDSQLQHQGSIHKALVSPRVNEYPERFRPFTPVHRVAWRGVRAMEDGKLPVWLTSVLVPA